MQPQMKVLALVSEKGGSGKTTTAVSMGVAAELQGYTAAIFDLDPRANSAVWGDRRDGKPPVVVPAQAPRLPLLIEQARKQNAGFVILDTPGNDLRVAEAACAAADLILIPCRPSPPDLLSIVPTVKTALAAGKPTFVMLNAAPVQGNEISEARESIEGAGVSVCPIVLYHRKAFMNRFHEGLTAFESDPKGKAAEELRTLFLWIAENAGLISNHHSIKLSKQHELEASN
jgi:chromosome partitioning protein